jgi:hypothetical protein
MSCALLYIPWRPIVFRGESHEVHGKELLEEVCGAEGGEVEAPGRGDEDD